MNSKEPEKIENIVISEIIGLRPIKPATYEMRKLRKSKEDIIVCYNYEQALQNWEKEAQKAGGRGTPYSVILAGDQKIAIPGALPYESIKTSLDALLK